MPKRRLIEIRGVATAMEPIHHGGDKTGGNMTEFRRQKIGHGENAAYLPVVSGNSIAGIMRDNCAWWSLDQIDFGTFTDLRPFDLLTSGGALVKTKSDKYINTTEERRLRELLPVISLFGGSVGNRMLEGRIDVDDWLLICQEYLDRLDPEYHDEARGVTIYDQMDELNFIRRDDKKSREWQDAIDPDTLAQWQREQADRSENEEAERAGGATSMIFGREVLIAGTRFTVRFVLRNPSDLELGCFFGGLGYFYARPKIGGINSRAHGRVRLQLQQYQITGPGRVEHPLAVETAEAASAYLRENRDEIVQLLGGEA